MSSVHVKCITKYTREVALAFECTRAVLSVLVKFVFTFLKENARVRMPKLRVKLNYSRNI